VIDAHAHLQDEAFKKDLKEVLIRARLVGVEAIINAAVDFDDSVKCLEISREYDLIYPVIGLAPYSKLSQIKAVMQLIEGSPDVVGIGEIGLDWPYQKNEAQMVPFKKQTELADELDIPVVIHSRSAGKYCINTLIEMKAKKVLMHAYDGSIKDARRAWENGFYFSIPLTVLVNPEKQKLAKEIPDKFLMLETDSPVLNPTKERNEPANLQKSRDFIAELRGVKPKKIEKLSTDNAKRLFSLK